MSRLRYPFTEISARCRLCGAVGLTASSEHALGGRLIDWRRSHALVCPEWPRWAATKGLRLDERGALLYPNESGPYEPKSRSKGEDDDDDDSLADEADGSEPVIDGAVEPVDGSVSDPTSGIEAESVVDVAPEPAPEPVANGAPAPARRTNGRQRPSPPAAPRVDLMFVPAEDLEQAELF